MTTVVVEKDENGCYKGFYCSGHAKFARKRLFGYYEPDILCAAISIITIHTINGMTELAHEQIAVKENEEDGFLKCDFLNPISDASVLLMDSMVLTLQQLSKEYGNKYLQVKIKEV